MANCLAVLNKAPRSPGTSKNDSNGQILPTPHLKIFRLSELRSATSNFPPDAIIGEGGFGTVFKGWLDEKTLAPAKPGSGMVTAVEKLNAESMHGIQEWQSEIGYLGRLLHPNLVKLLGYCLDKKGLLLVYEFMAEGSLEQHLFKKVSQPLSWSTRLKILIGAARGLAFLHTSDKQVIYRDFKASNILLDSNYHAKLSDFGLAKKGPPPKPIHPKPKTKLKLKPVPTCAPPMLSDFGGRVVGTYGYPAPKDVATGDLYGKSDDVYGFGGVLLEMLTGLRALDASRPSGQQNLVDWTRPLLSDRRKLEGIMDKQLKGQYLPEVALKAAQLSLKCTLNDPRSRPSMKEVVDALEQIEAIKQKPKKVAPTAKLKTTAPTAKPKTAPTAKPKTAAHPAKPKTAAPTAAPTAKPKTAAHPAKPKTAAHTAKPKTAAHPAKPKTAAPTAAPTAKPKTAAHPAKPKTAAHPAKPKTAAPTAKPKTAAHPAKPKDGRSH